MLIIMTFFGNFALLNDYASESNNLHIKSVLRLMRSPIHAALLLMQVLVILLLSWEMIKGFSQVLG
jgi:hypothetical protein